LKLGFFYKLLFILSIFNWTSYRPLFAPNNPVIRHIHPAHPNPTIQKLDETMPEDKKLSAEERLDKLEAGQAELKKDVAHLQGDARLQRVVISGLPGVLLLTCR
jgi:hypothetical protein